MAEETYQQTFCLGDRIEAGADNCFIGTPHLRTRRLRHDADCRLVGDGPLRVKFMKPEEAV
jgi:hypothetical protein